MATYLILNLAFLATLLLLRPRHIRLRKYWLIMLSGLLVLTAIFDSLLIALDVIRYNPEKLLGLYIGRAPVEDFFYSLYAACLMPLLWEKVGKRDAKN